MSAISPYDDWPAWAGSPLEGLAALDSDQAKLVDVLGIFEIGALDDPEVVTELRYDGVDIQRLRWETGIGPSTEAWLVRPAEAGADRLPGVLALHPHGAVRSVGAASLVESGPDARLERLRRTFYAGRAPVNDLAKQGFAVLAHDAFSWGSRRFTLQATSEDEFDVLADAHEATIVKTASLLGTSLAGMVLRDDLIALHQLSRLLGGSPTLGAFGFSGGGVRAALLAALSRQLEAAVICCAMSSWRALVPNNISHSWLLNSPGLPRLAEFADIAGRSPRASLLVQFAALDPSFPPEGMADADALLKASQAAAHGRYEGRFFEAAHIFSGPMQDQAWAFLLEKLGAASP